MPYVQDAVAPRNFIIPSIINTGGNAKNQFFVSGPSLIFVSGAIMYKVATSGPL